jgi:CRISPR-associated endonuclease Csn1
VKRAIWQTMLIVKEIVKIKGYEPKKIFVEMTRNPDSEKKRTVSRKNRLKELYEKCKEEESYLFTELNNVSDTSLKSDRLYLYYTQKGRCMYSGEPISLEDLYDKTLYDIDHIYPQSKVMDDSINNRVLVKRVLNEEKSDVYPINEKIRHSQAGFWAMLKNQGFISEEKFKRLTRNTPFDDNELAGFIARQIVETSQSTKAVAEVLKNVYASEIVYVKSGVVSKFRQKYDLIKVRDVNDYHHAKDAFLNIVVGNAYNVKFTHNPLNFVKTNERYTYNLEKLFEHDIKTKNALAWKGGADGTIGKVKKIMSKNNVLFTRYSYEKKGELFDSQLVGKGKGQVYIKDSDERLHDISKYGGYNKASGAYFMLVESIKGRRNIRTIEVVPIYLKDKIENDNTYAINYLKNQCGLTEPKIILHNIKIDSLLNVDGFYMHLSGRTGKRLLLKNANQLCLSYEEEKLIKRMSKFKKEQSENEAREIVEKDNITEEALINLYDRFVDKLKNSIYKVRLSKQTSTLESGRDTFVTLSAEDKSICILEILNLFKCNSVAANLKKINGPENGGILVLNNDISNIKIKLINQSVTGIFEQSVDLNEI